MKCEEAVKRVPGLVLDELDVEERREMEAHLSACAPCRAEREAQAGAFGALRGVPAVETSASRREATVAGMVKARDEMVRLALVKRSSRWPSRLAAAAAVLAVAALGTKAFWPAPAWQVTLERQKGDVIVLESSGARIQLEGSDASGRSEQTAKVQIIGGDRIVLKHGTITAETSRRITIENLRGDRFELVSGAVSLTVDRVAIAGASTMNSPDEKPAVRFKGDWLRVHVARGQGTLSARAGGEVPLEAGDEGRIDDVAGPVRK